MQADRRDYCCEACLAGARCQCGELGSVSRKLVHYAGCSVLVVKEKAAEQGQADLRLRPQLAGGPFKSPWV